MGNASSAKKKETKSIVHSNHYTLTPESFEATVYEHSFGNLELLPLESLLHVLSYLDFNSLLAISLTSKALFVISSDDSLWKSLYFLRTWYSFNFNGHPDVRTTCCWKSSFIHRITTSQEKMYKQISIIETLDLNIGNYVAQRDSELSREAVKHRVQCSKIETNRLYGMSCVWVALSLMFWLVIGGDVFTCLAFVSGGTYFVFKIMEGRDPWTTENEKRRYMAVRTQIEKKWQERIDSLKEDKKKAQRVLEDIKYLVGEEMSMKKPASKPKKPKSRWW